MAAPTLIAFSSANSGTTGTNSQASATLTWQTGDVLVCLAGNEGNGSHAWSAPTNTGSGLSWTPQQVHSTTGTDCGVAVWTAVATAGSSGIITANCPSSAAMAMGMGVYQFRAQGTDTISVGASQLVTGATSSPQTGAITMTKVDSSVCWAAGDWSAHAVESPSPAATTHGSGAPGPTASPFAQAFSTNYTLYLTELDDETSTGSQSFGYSGTSTGPYTIVVLEVVSTPAAAVVGPQPSFRAIPFMAPQGGIL
jgi:hypothetical protein